MESTTIGDRMYEGRMPDMRYRRTMTFLESCITRDERILDLGIPNPLSRLMQAAGFQVRNTQGEDLDLQYAQLDLGNITCITSFEVFEHLLAPFNLLRTVQPPAGGTLHLVCSVPLKVWFAKAWWSRTDPWDRHYHEFEPRQFDWLLEKSGWTIIRKETWASPPRLTLGIRPFLRFFYPSYYFVHAEKRGSTSTGSPSIAP